MKHEAACKDNLQFSALLAAICLTAGVLPTCATAVAFTTIDDYDYTVTCTSSFVDWASANSLCTALGSEWSMAAIRSASVNALSSMTSSTIWFGAKNVNGGTGQYNYMNGRWAGKVLSIGYLTPTCYQYCQWSGSQPDHYPCSAGPPNLPTYNAGFAIMG